MVTGKGSQARSFGTSGVRGRQRTPLQESIDTAHPRLNSAAGRWIVAATTLGSSVVSLDATVVNIALPRIGQSLHGTVADLQWVSSGYLLTLAALILLGGSLGDKFGRRRMFVWGTTGFAMASALCGVAPTMTLLIVGRLVQGVAGALLTPGSLALLSASIDSRDRGAAIGLWSGLSGISGAVGPILGGWLLEVAGWRATFLINVPLTAVVIAVSLMRVPDSRDPGAVRRLDMSGTLVVVAALGLLTYGLIDSAGWFIAAGVGLGGVFVVLEHRSPHPLVSPSLFTHRLFAVANLVTLVVYAALGGVFFLLVLQLQVVSGYSPIRAGMATIPITAVLLVFSPTAGRWAQRHGPRGAMTTGPLLSAVGLTLLIPLGLHVNYLTEILPGTAIFGCGLAVLVAPLTDAALGSVSPREAGIASGVNNAVARSAQLLAVAALPTLAGIPHSGFAGRATLSAGYHTAMWICVGLLAAGAILAAAFTRSPSTSSRTTTRPIAPTGE